LKKVFSKNLKKKGLILLNKKLLFFFT